MKLLDLFSGIGGFSYGLEKVGFRTVAFCEVNDYCQRVLAKNFPNVPVFGDIAQLTAGALRARGVEEVDIICGGFPCQDVSDAGPRTGIEGHRSGLWGHYARLIGELRPRYAIVENVPGLLNRGFETVLGDLAALGYDAIWECIPARAVGAPHRRDRVWVIAYSPERVSHPPSLRPQEEWLQERAEPVDAWPTGHSGWEVEPDLVRVANGLPGRVDRVAALGNSIVPKVAEVIGRAIAKAEECVVNIQR